ncbi:unnamed protein product [Bursaphelenchus okinawaensis]|uniref:Uncharacterized protein n=1 Tax=Bursaphelenchus okinawaensis TaxID=465554 RepID=A0A811KDF4_9BILA|nr:unnamed protein product [Bursaphelenchus okinawaensis]CAG9102606.1 unnamed protein product [Bursaphelenchus okinawaensis]
MTVFKLRRLNNIATKTVKSHTGKRRKVEYMLLIISITSPLLFLLKSCVYLLDFPTGFFKVRVLEGFICFYFLDYLIVQAFAIVQLIINPSFWSFVKAGKIDPSLSTKELNHVQLRSKTVLPSQSQNVSFF